MSMTAALTNALTLLAVAGIAFSITMIALVILPLFDRHHRWF